MTVTCNSSAAETAFEGKCTLTNGKPGNERVDGCEVMVNLWALRRQTTANVEHWVILVSATGRR